MSSSQERQFSLFEPTSDRETEEKRSAAVPVGRNSNFIVYVDESGDHGLHNIDSNYPIFVLAFCIFYKAHYSEKVVPALEKLKFNNFGHDIVILHERDIRKEAGGFKFANQLAKDRFIGELTDIIETSNFILVSCIIDKKAIPDSGASGNNPYHLALGFCLETLHQFLTEKGQENKKTHVVFEARGKKEDKDLELEFRRVCDGNNRLERHFPFEIIIADKKANSSGLQLADLVARPIGMSFLRPEQPNKAFEVLKRKFFCAGGRPNVGENYEDWGLKIFPVAESEKPR